MKNIQLVQTDRSLNDRTFPHTFRNPLRGVVRSLGERAFFALMTALVIGGVVKLEDMPE